MSAHLASPCAQGAGVPHPLVCTPCSLATHVATLLAWAVLGCAAAPWCAAGGTCSLAGGQWLGGCRPVVCQQCPSAGPPIAVCNDNKVESRPGYYTLYTTDSRRANSYSTVKVRNLIVLRLTPVFMCKVARCPNSNACKNVGLVDSACEASVLACNNNATSSTNGSKCDQGYTGVQHSEMKGQGREANERPRAATPN